MRRPLVLPPCHVCADDGEVFGRPCSKCSRGGVETTATPRERMRAIVKAAHTPTDWPDWFKARPSFPLNREIWKQRQQGVSFVEMAVGAGLSSTRIRQRYLVTDAALRRCRVAWSLPSE